MVRMDLWVLRLLSVWGLFFVPQTSQVLLILSEPFAQTISVDLNSCFQSQFK